MEIFLAALAGNVAIVYLVIAAVIVPKIKLTGAGRLFEQMFRAGAVMFFVGCGFSHLHIAIHAVTDPPTGVIHQVWMHFMQVFGGWAFIWAAVKFLDITVDRRSPQRAELEEQAFRDPLTGAFNRRHFDTMFEYELVQRERTHQPFCVLMIDLNDFKPINDLLGHGTGDQVLCDVATALGTVLRPTDTYARLGGDEFGVLLVGADRSTAELVTDRIHQQIAQIDPGSGLRLTASIGLAFCPGNGASCADLLADADEDMYRNKRNHKEGAAAVAMKRLSSVDRSPSPVVAPRRAPARDFATS